MAAQTGEPASMLELYRSALASRPRDEPFAWLESPRGSLAFSRGDLACVVNVDAEEVELPAGDLLLASAPEIRASLPPDTAAWVRTKGAR